MRWHCAALLSSSSAVQSEWFWLRWAPLGQVWCQAALFPLWERERESSFQAHRWHQTAVICRWCHMVLMHFLSPKSLTVTARKEGPFRFFARLALGSKTRLAHVQLIRYLTSCIKERHFLTQLASAIFFVVVSKNRLQFGAAALLIIRHPKRASAYVTDQKKPWKNGCVLKEWNR